MSDGLSEGEARTTLKEIKSRLDSLASKEEGASFLKEIHSSLFTNEPKTVYSTGLDLSRNAKAIVIEKYYSNILENILSIAARPWFHSLKKKEAKVYGSFFTEADPQDVFIGLTIVLAKSRHTNVIKECIELLEKFMDDGRCTELFWNQAKILPKILSGANPTYDPSVILIWNDLIRKVVSLPDKVANVFKLPKGSVLWPKNFFLILGKTIVEVLNLLHEALTASKDCSLGFLSQITAKICVMNHGDDIFRILLPEIEKMIQLSPLWCRICHKLFSSFPDSSLEAVIEPLLTRCRSPILLFNLLGDIARSEGNRLKFLMTHKFVLHRCYNKDTIPYCTVGYLAQSRSDGDKPLVETLKKLLDVWGNASALKHRPHEQHLYITKCILLAIGFLRQKYKGGAIPQELGSALTMKLLDSLPPHLESPIENFRHLGMVVAEEITSISQVKDIQPLKFEFARNEEIEYLSSIAHEPAAVFKRFNAEQETADVQQTDVKSYGKEKPSQNQPSPEVSQTSNGESDLDSDDDLEPYPMDEEDDATISGVRPPVYLSECISGLLSKDDPSRVEACLMVTEKLVRREPAELPEVAVELVKILLYLQDNYNTKDFILLRHGAMVATAVKCPKRVVEYLTTEFYQENYNLRQRMDMLEVISATAQELSQPVDEDPKSLRKHLPLPSIPGITPRDKPDWQVVVEERIKSKTRIISRGRKNPEPIAVANKFSSVAGDFFFPLLRNFDSKCNTFDLLGQDFIVLGKLVQTLGSIIQASAGLNITHLMASAMLDFIWGVRYHREPFVRQALLYAMCMIVLACPTYVLIAELNSEIMECHCWVSDVGNNDPDTDCRKLALQALILLDEAIKKEFS